MLTDLGGKDVDGMKCEEPDTIYFINHSGDIDFIEDYDEQASIIMDCYKEIRLPEQWKDGDILINNNGTDYKVFWEYNSDSDTAFYAHNMSMHVNGTLTKDSGGIWHGCKLLCFRKYYRLATPSEVNHFHELLHKLGKEWNAEKKELVEWRWKPKKGESYWFIGHHGLINDYIWGSNFTDIQLFDFGNCFRTRKEAEVMAEKIKKLLKGETDI